LFVEESVLSKTLQQIVYVKSRAEAFIIYGPEIETVKPDGIFWIYFSFQTCDIRS